MDDRFQTKKGLDRMVEIEQFVSRFATFLQANKVRLKVERKSDDELTPEDEVARLVFEEDGIELMIAEHQGGEAGFIESFLCGVPYERREWLKVPHGPRVTGHARDDRLIDKIGYLGQVGGDRPLLIEGAALERISRKVRGLEQDLQELQVALIQGVNGRAVAVRPAHYTLSLGVHVRQEDDGSWSAVDAGSDDEADWSHGHPTREAAIRAVLPGRLRKTADALEGRNK